jgi:hypothetical protein
MTSNVFVGLPVTSHNNSALCTATFTNVTVTATAASSSLAFAEEDAKSSRKLLLYPNPVQDDKLSIESILPATTVVRIQMLNLFGQVMLEKDLGKQEAGILSHEMDLSGYAKGTYIVRLQSASGYQSAFFIRK